MAATPSTFAPSFTRPLISSYQRLSGSVIKLGHMLWFFIRAVGGIPTAFRQYRKEFLRLLSDIAWGNGSIVVGGEPPGWRWCWASPPVRWSPSRATTS